MRDGLLLKDPYSFSLAAYAVNTTTKITAQAAANLRIRDVWTRNRVTAQSWTNVTIGIPHMLRKLRSAMTEGIANTIIDPNASHVRSRLEWRC